MKNKIKLLLSPVSLFRYISLHLKAYNIIGKKRQKIVSVAQRYSHSPWVKYSDYNKWVRRDVRIARKCSLHCSDQVLDILDIGCGAGFFCAVAKFYGHRATGIDIEDEFFSEIANILDIDRRISPVEPYKKLDLPNNYNLIVVSGALFDFCYEDVGSAKMFWSDEMWEFFLSDLYSLLDDEGKLYLRVSRGRKNWPTFYSNNLILAFSCGLIHRNEYLFTKKMLGDVVDFLRVSFLSDKQRAKYFNKLI